MATAFDGERYRGDVDDLFVFATCCRLMYGFSGVSLASDVSQLSVFLSIKQEKWRTEVRRELCCAAIMRKI